MTSKEILFFERVMDSIPIYIKTMLNKTKQPSIETYNPGQNK